MRDWETLGAVDPKGLTPVCSFIGRHRPPQEWASSFWTTSAADGAAFAELGRYFANADRLLRALAAVEAGSVPG